MPNAAEIAEFRRLARVKPLSDFIEAASQILMDDPLGFEICEGHFRKLISSGFLLDLLNGELRDLITRSNYYMGIANESRWTLYSNQYLGIDVRLVGPGPAPPSRVTSLTEDVMVYAVSKGGVLADLYRQTSALDVDRAEIHAKLQSLGSMRLDEAPITMRAWRDLFAIHSDISPAILVIFSSNTRISVRCEYDLSTGKPLRLIEAGPTTSRIQFACRVLARMGFVDAGETIFELRQHPDYQIRWSAVETMLDLDFARGVEMLRFSLADSNAHIRSAAQKSLESLQSLQENA